MRNVKKIFSSILAVILCMSALAVTAGAANIVDTADTGIWEAIWKWQHGKIAFDNWHVGNCVLKDSDYDVGLTLDSSNEENGNGLVLSHMTNGSNNDVMDLTEYKETGYLVFDIKLETELQNPENSILFKFQSTDWKGYQFKVSSDIADAAKSDWTRVEIPFTDIATSDISFEKVGYMRIIRIGAAVDCNVYLKDIGVYAKKPAPKASFTEMGLTAKGEKCIRIAYTGKYEMSESALEKTAYKLIDKDNNEYAALSVEKISSETESEIVTEVYELVFDAVLEYPADYSVEISSDVLDSNDAKIDEETSILTFQTPITGDQGIIKATKVDETTIPGSVIISAEVVVETAEVKDPKLIWFVKDGNKIIAYDDGGVDCGNDGGIENKITITASEKSEYKVYAFVVDTDRPICKVLEVQ